MTEFYGQLVGFVFPEFQKDGVSLVDLVRLYPAKPEGFLGFANERAIVAALANLDVLRFAER
jgi:hypothetical protein